MTKRCKQNKRKVLGLLSVAGPHILIVVKMNKCGCSAKRCTDVVLDIRCGKCSELDVIWGYCLEDIQEIYKVSPHQFDQNFKFDNGGSK